MKAELKISKREGLFNNIVRNKYLFILVLPALLSVFIFSYVPMVGIVISFMDFDIIKGLSGSDWVGFKHFIDIFTNEELLASIVNTLWYGVVLLFGTFPMPIILALLINEVTNMRFKKVVQTISYLPHFISMIAVVGMFYAFFSVTGTYNDLMCSIIGEGYERRNLLMDSKFFLPIIYTASLWKTVGWNSVIYLAAIAGVDQTMFEAATVDGCSKLKQILYITIPSIKGTILVVLIMSLGGLFNTNFELVNGFQNVFTQAETDVISTVIYRQGIQNGKYSLSTAFGLAQGIVTLIVTVLANTLSKKVLEVSIW